MKRNSKRLIQSFKKVEKIYLTAEKYVNFTIMLPIEDIYNSSGYSNRKFCFVEKCFEDVIFLFYIGLFYSYNTIKRVTVQKQIFITRTLPII